MKHKIFVSAVIEVETDNPEIDPYFHFEDSGCPGTGEIGRIIATELDFSAANNVCGACNLRMHNNVIGGPNFIHEVLRNYGLNLGPDGVVNYADAWSVNPVELQTDRKQKFLMAEKAKVPDLF